MIRNFSTSITSDPVFCNCSALAQLLYFKLYMHPQNHLCGLFMYSVDHMAVDVKANRETTIEALRELTDSGFVEVDRTCNLVWIRASLSAWPRLGATQARCIELYVAKLPKSSLGASVLTVVSQLRLTAPRDAKHARIMLRDGYRCRYCCGSTDLTIDHLVPPRFGGTQKDSNLVTCCRPCNSRKGSRTPNEAKMVVLPIEVQG